MLSSQILYPLSHTSIPPSLILKPMSVAREAQLPGEDKGSWILIKESWESPGARAREGEEELLTHSSLTPMS
jgi:hypothetical protein